MERLKPQYLLKIDKVDAMLVCALVVVLSSYALGYKLDWSRLDQPGTETAAHQVMSDDDEEAEANAAEEPPLVADRGTPITSMGPAPQAAAPVSMSQAPTVSVTPATPAPMPADAVGLTPSQVDPKEAAWAEMTAELERTAARHHGRVAIFVKDLKEGRTWAYHENDLFPSASLIKVPIMAAVFAKIRDGQATLHDRIALRRHNRVGGSGSLKWTPDGARFTVTELLQRMIHESDNTATSMLIEHVGLGYIQRQFPSFGLLYTGIYQEGMSIKSGRVQNENYTTAREMSLLMEKIYKGELVDRPSSRMMLEILKHKKAVASRLQKGLPSEWEIAHKTGLLRNACHDVAIILTPNGDYSITVLTGSNQSYKVAKDFISRLGRVTYTHYGGYPQYYAARGKRSRQLARR